MRLNAIQVSALPAACLALGALVAADDARACGGFFCSTGPVDQQQESILFEIGEETTSVVVQVGYNGDPGDFSWVIPVPEVPDIDVVPPLVLDILGQQARPQILPAPLSYDGCDENNSFFPSSGVGCSDYTAPAPPTPEAAFERIDDDGENEGVEVVELERVGPYADIVVVSSEDPQELIDWLNDNGYVITPAMEPLVGEYVAEGWRFLALKLAPEAGVQDIAPFKFTCPSENPTIPLRLTAVAAEPGMRILVHVVGEQRYAPMNYRSISLEERHLRTDLYGFRDNYDAVVSWQVAEEGGRGFVTERAGPSDELRQRIAAITPSNDTEAAAQSYLTDLLERHPYLTRMDTRMRALDMDDDPVFLPMASGSDVAGLIDLSGRPAQDACLPANDPEPACGFSFCGAGARCAVTEDGEEGCLCDAGQVARQVLEPTRMNPVPVVTCQSPDEDVLGTEAIGDPCAGFSCGEAGACVAVNGFPTCDCGDLAAVPDLGRFGGVRCEPAAQSFDTDRLHEPVPLGEPLTGEEGTSGAAPAGASCGSSALAPSAVEALALGLLVWALRRRRKNDA